MSLTLLFGLMTLAPAVVAILLVILSRLTTFHLPSLVAFVLAGLAAAAPIVGLILLSDDLTFPTPLRFAFAGNSAAPFAPVFRADGLSFYSAWGIAALIVPLLLWLVWMDAGRSGGSYGRLLAELGLVIGLEVCALLFAFPAAWLVQTGETWAVAVAFVGGLGVIYGIVYGPLAAFWSELFDTRYRYTALSTLYQVSGIVASGFTPLIAAWLVTRGDGTLWLVAAYNAGVAALSLVCAWLLPETRGRDLQVDEAPTPHPGRHLEPVQTGSPSASRSSSASVTISS